MHALLSQGENQDQIGKPVRPGGEEEGEGRWRKDANASSEKKKEKTDGKPVEPTNLDYFPVQDGHCHSPAFLLGKKKYKNVGGLFPWEKGHEGGLASVAPSHFSISCSRIWPTCV